MSTRGKILLNNAWSAWRKAIYYADAIHDGRATFDNRKNFVSALHNAVELFLKQLMLDQNDHRVATPRNLKDAACDLARKYYASDNLNSFFESLNDSERSKFHSIDFHDFFDLHKELLKKYPMPNTHFKTELKTLSDLRNNETHFFIDMDSYLTEAEFQMLYNFMITFYGVLHRYNLLPYFGKASGPNSLLSFTRAKLTSFSYRDALINSKSAKNIEKYANGLLYFVTSPSSAYETAVIIFMEIPELEYIPFDILLEYITVMFSFNMVEWKDSGSFHRPVHSSDDSIYEGDDEVDIFKLYINLK